MSMGEICETARVVRNDYVKQGNAWLMRSSAGEWLKHMSPQDLTPEQLATCEDVTPEVQT